MLDLRFPAINLFTVSLHHAKTQVLTFLLENDMIKGRDILDLSQGQQFLGEMEKELDNLLNS